MRTKLKEIFRLESVKYLNEVSIRMLLKKNDTAEECQQLKDEDLTKAGISRYGISNLRKAKFNDRDYELQIRAAERINDLKLITYFDKEYPDNLKNIFDPPMYLFYQGELTPDDNISIGIVGSRMMSTSGVANIKRISYELSNAGFVIISGLAMGADTIAHKGAVEAGNRTVGVLGAGIDKEVNLYSRSTRKKILDCGGAIISPYKIGTPGSNYTFPARNRIISGMSLGVIIGEAKVRSGSLITASFALEQGKEVFALPNMIYREKFEGSNNLIKTGQAKLIMGVGDVIDEMPENIKNILSPAAQQIECKKVILNDEIEEKIYKQLIRQKMSIDELSEILNVGTSILMSKLLILELNRIIVREQNNIFAINR